MKTMTKYLLGMCVMTDITCVINKHSENNIFIYPLRKYDYLLRIKRVWNYDDPKIIFDLLLIIIVETSIEYRLYEYFYVFWWKKLNEPIN